MDSLEGRRITLISRIFAPEPGAASLRLRALAQRLHDRNAVVTVRTSAAPRGMQALPEPYVVRRTPVLRDRAGYVRGYLQYLSFDIPAFFRVLFARRSDALVVEPPPTTGIFVRVAAAMRRTPYYFFAADVWSEAAAVAGSPAIVVRTVRAFEHFVYSGARTVLAVSESVATRVLEVSPSAHVHLVGNGFDASVFSPHGAVKDIEQPYLLYAGTASEVHGASVFVEALPQVIAAIPDAKIVFIGQGSERDAIAASAERLAPDSVVLLPRQSPEETARWIRGANATLASMLPGGYDAFPTKMYASIGCGVPVVYAGDGSGREFAKLPDVGWGVDYSPATVAEAMLAALQNPIDPEERARRAAFAIECFSLAAVADRIADVLANTPDQRRTIK